MLCCICGIESTSPKCLRCSITSSINYIKETLEHCRSCDRYLSPPKKWVSCDLNSKDLLHLIIKKSSYLKSVEICRANFLPSEVHSKRIKIEIEYRGTLTVGTDRDINFKKDGRILINPLADQNVNKIVLICVVRNRQCAECQNVEAKNYWSCVVQVRQKRGRRNLLMLQNEVLENKIEFSFLEETKNGVDFFFGDKVRCRNFLNFLHTKIGIKLTESERIISQDMRNNTKKSKLTYSVEIYPIDQDDFVVLDSDFAKKKDVSPKMIAVKIGTTIQFIDIFGKPFSISSDAFWKNRDKFSVIKDCRDLQKFIVTEIDTKNSLLTDIYLTIDYTTVYHTKTHIANQLSEDDIVWGYNFTNTNHSEWENTGFQIFAVRKYLNDIVGDKFFGFFSEDLHVKNEKKKGNDPYDKTNDLVENFEKVNLNI
ncbi:60S ribosomal export protein NMD3 [Dictyocoela muelleri]|nr:60S ribosomal export protein NMD3 [Dictyocoela muelleri]